MPTLFLHFFLFLITTSLTNLIPTVHSNCIEAQKQSLLHFKKNLLFDSSFSSKLITWNSSADCCSWLGVTCSSNGHVVGLDLSGEHLFCSLDDSSTLFQLQNLQSLNLAYNNFNLSSIPSAIGKLADLRYLNLSSADFSGQIPIEVARLTRLVTLDLSNSGQSLLVENPNLRMLFQNLTELAELYLDSVDLPTQESDWCEAISSSLPNLRVLSLSNCGLPGPICESLAKLQSLYDIDLSFNSFNSPVPRVFANLSNLTYLSLSKSKLHGTFPKEIFQIPSLQTIDLSDNVDLHGSFPEFPKNGSLRSLTVYSTSFSGDIPNSIGNLKMLSSILLSDCNFTGSLPKSIENLTQLVELDIPGNRLNSCISSIHWGNLVNLRSLNLGYNQLSGTIPSSLFSLSKWESLNLYSNRFSDFSGQVPEFSNSSSNLLDTHWNLDLSGNCIQGKIPNWIFSLKYLFTLSLSYNSFTTLEAPLPNSTSILYSLDLSSNELLDIPSSYSFPQLAHLVLASNKLKTFPVFLRNLDLMTLDLSDNQIQGQIPNWIWRFTYIQILNFSCNSFKTLEAPPPNSTYGVPVLDLHSNQLEGQIPLFLSGDFIDYSRNNFTRIPKDIGDFVSAGSISLSSNNLHGVIPKSICNVSDSVLDLSNNSLSGNIPQCLIQDGKLSVLDLSRNKLTGYIPDNFQKACKLETLDLNRNQIQGHFPKSLVNSSSLVFLNLGNNYIRDPFPCSLMNISTLRVLVLRSNKFYGSIGCPDTNDTWSMLQVIDLAHNSFSGDMAGRMFLKWQAMVSNEDDSAISLAYDGSLRIRGPLANYKNTVTTFIKGLQLDLPKILTIFTLIDFSSNKFNGSIPHEIGELKSLYFLNLSRNAFTGNIPSSFGQMRQLESLDLSNNHLSGKIPQQMTNLTFLAFLNLSNNELVGKIPTGSQFPTFPNTSFQGNKGLWGPPLTTDALLPPPTSNGSSTHLNSGNDHIDWDIISAEIGFTCGFGLAVGSLLFCKRWRKWYYRAMRSILFKLFPQLEQRFGNHRRHVYVNTTR